MLPISVASKPVRTLVDIPEQDIAALDAVRRRRQVSRSEVIRQAVRDYLGRNAPPDAEVGFGLWGEGGVDGVDYQRRLRAEW